MLPRLITLTIVLFWLTMTALLIKDEYAPAGSSIREVPLTHVLKLIYLHEQPSDLKIYNDSTFAGDLHFQPRMEGKTVRLLDFSGRLNIRTPIATRRIAWDGMLKTDRAFKFTHVTFGLTVHEPTPMRAEIELRPNENLAHVTVKSNADILSRNTYTLDEAGLRQLLEQVNIDPMMLSAVQSKQSDFAPKVSARRSSLRLHEETVQTYLVAISQSGQTLAEIHISQIGQILRAKTTLGYTLLPEGIQP